MLEIRNHFISVNLNSILLEKLDFKGLPDFCWCTRKNWPNLKAFFDEAVEKAILGLESAHGANKLSMPKWMGGEEGLSEAEAIRGVSSSQKVERGKIGLIVCADDVLVVSQPGSRPDDHD
jgi:hypothetical protein